MAYERIGNKAGQNPAQSSVTPSSNPQCHLLAAIAVENRKKKSTLRSNRH